MIDFLWKNEMKNVFYIIFRITLHNTWHYYIKNVQVLRSDYRKFTLVNRRAEFNFKLSKHTRFRYVKAKVQERVLQVITR